MSDIREYFDSLRGKRSAVIGMGVSNTPLIRMLLRADLDVTVCDRAQRERVEEQAEELESLGARLRQGHRRKNSSISEVTSAPRARAASRAGWPGCRPGVRKITS